MGLPGGFSVAPTMHIGELEQIASRFEQEGQLAAALETYRQLVTRETPDTERGRRFQAKVAELEARLRAPAPRRLGERARGIIIGGIVVLACCAVGFWAYSKYFAPKLRPIPTVVASTAPVPPPPPVATPTNKEADNLAAANIIVENYRAISARNYDAARALRTKKCKDAEASRFVSLDHLFSNNESVRCDSAKTKYNDGTTAHVYAAVTARDRNANGTVVQTTTYWKFILRKEGGTWKIDDIPQNAR